MRQFRYWLIWLLAGSDAIMLNVDFNSQVTIFVDKGARGLFRKCNFVGGIAVEEK